MVNCLEFIRRSIQAIKQETIVGCWKKLCPVNDDVVEDLAPINEHVKCIIDLAQSVGGEGFSDMSKDEIHELIADDVELSEEDLVDMLENCTVDIVVDESHDISQMMTLSAVSDILKLSDELKKKIMEHDDNLERSVQF